MEKVKAVMIGPVNREGGVANSGESRRSEPPDVEVRRTVRMAGRRGDAGRTALFSGVSSAFRYGNDQAGLWN